MVPVKVSPDRRERPFVDHVDGVTPVVGTTVACALIVTMALYMDRVSYDAVAGALTFLVLVLVTTPVLRWVASREGAPRMATVLTAALVLKLSFALVRFALLGDGDAVSYSQLGADLSRLFRQGQFMLEIPGASKTPEGSRVVLVTAVIYTITGVSRFAASFVFSWFAFIGQVFMWRAFRRAVPDGDTQRYGYLVLLLPSMLFWPSSIGKEALMVLCIGVASYGASQILGESVRLAGVLIFLAGVTGLLFVRPHMAAIAIVSLLVASAVGALAGFQRGRSKMLAVRVVALVAMVGAASVAVTQVSVVFSDGSSDEVGVEAVLAKAQGQTSTGNSQFEPIAVTTPLDLPAGIVTVLFRPFPWEVRNVTGVMSATEGLLLIAIVFAGRRRLLSWLKSAHRNTYLVYAAVFALVFIVAFSYIGNFGILARQRVQMMPLALTLLGMHALPRPQKSPAKIDVERPSESSR